MNCQERQDELLLYAAGELDGPEREALRAHLESGCLTCAGSLAEAEAVVALLGESLDPVTPSAEARQRLRAELPRRVKGPAARGRSENYVWGGWLPLAMAACVALVASIGVAVYLSNQAALRLKEQTDRASALSGRLDTRDSQIAAADVRYAQLKRENAALAESLHNAMVDNDQLVQLLHKKDVSIVMLAGNEQPAASAVMIMDQPQREAQFIAAKLQAPAAGRAYELWLVPKDGKPIPAGVFAPHANGAVSMRVDVPENTGPITTLAVTDEPAEGVPQPTAKAFVVSGQVVTQ